MENYTKCVNPKTCKTGTKEGGPSQPQLNQPSKTGAMSAQASKSGGVQAQPSTTGEPIIVQFEDVAKARALIEGGVRVTPCDVAHLPDTDIEVYLKKEYLQYTGSFKERGARNALMNLSDDAKKRGVVCCSMGNHAQGMSYHGYALNIPVTVCMPVAAPIMKVQKCRNFHANVVLEGQTLEDAKALAKQLAEEQGLTDINPYDHPHVIAGQGTIGMEILEQVPDVDVIVVPVGGGGMISGISVAVKKLKPSCKVIGVESENCAGFTNALKHGKPTTTDTKATLADGLAVPLVGTHSFATGKDNIDEVIVVKEEFIALGILRLIELEKAVCEGAGATGVAAVLSGQLDEYKGKKMVIVLSGGNIDTTLLGRCLDRGMAADGRLVRFKVTINDKPGGLCELCTLLTSIGISMKDIYQERAWLTGDVFAVEVTVVCETKDNEHSKELMALLGSKFTKVSFLNVKEQGWINV